MTFHRSHQEPENWKEVSNLTESHGNDCSNVGRRKDDCAIIFYVSFLLKLAKPCRQENGS